MIDMVNGNDLLVTWHLEVLLVLLQAFRTMKKKKEKEKVLLMATPQCPWGRAFRVQTNNDEVIGGLDKAVINKKKGEMALGMESWDMDNGENIVDAGKQKKEGSARYMGPTIQNYRSTSFLVQ
ncbi:hypothetical protein C5167_002887 [Papaver somniferum]|uniref:Uncharacterized protein n=1 Tax=Papaver somniferum TaxID=3469 RepID=A0A4Y7KZG4_PAPSO|nr:hypothetical protein C5167_002887 [Papaver somniferum]